MINIAICDDEAVVRSYLEQTLDHVDGITVVAAVADGPAALEVTAPVDVWLMDIRMPRLDGLETTRRLKARPHPPKVVLLTSLSTATLAEAVGVGVDGMLDKDLPVASLVASVQAVLGGVFVNSPRAVARLREVTVAPVPDGIVTDDKDVEILRLVRQGHGYPEIAEATGVSESTVKKRVGAMARRAGVRSRPRLMGVAANWSL